MPDLILLNGPPSSGKSTIASRLVAARPLALNLDIDAVRGSLGAWAKQPHEAGLAARTLAIAMTMAHLDQGHDVVVPQLLTRDAFILELEEVAAHAGARFVEIALLMNRNDMLEAFAARSAAPENQQHRDAQQLVELSGGTRWLDELHLKLMEFLDTRRNLRKVEAIRGDIESTVRLVEAAILDRH